MRKQFGTAGEACKGRLSCAETNDPRVYDYKGKTWKYEEGEDQISRYYKDGKVDFSILNPDKGAIVTVSGIPEDVSVNKSIVVNIKDNVTNVQTGMSVTVLRIKDGMAWLGANDGTGMIVKL